MSLSSGQGKMEGEARVGSLQGEAHVLLCPCLLPADKCVDLMARDLGNAAPTWWNIKKKGAWVIVDAMDQSQLPGLGCQTLKWKRIKRSLACTTAVLSLLFTPYLSLRVDRHDRQKAHQFDKESFKMDRKNPAQRKEATEDNRYDWEK